MAPLDLPEISVSHVNLTVREGENAVITCNGSGSPLPDVDWTVAELHSINTHQVQAAAPQGCLCPTWQEQSSCQRSPGPCMQGRGSGRWCEKREIVTSKGKLKTCSIHMRSWGLPEGSEIFLLYGQKVKVRELQSSLNELTHMSSDGTPLKPPVCNR